MTGHVVIWHYSTKEKSWIPICMPRRKTRPKFVTTTAKKKEVDCQDCLERLSK